MQQQESPRFGVIESLSLGFGLVARRPWLLALPVLLDLLLWFGPRVSVRPLMGSLSDMLTMAGALPEDLQQMVGFSQDVLGQIAEQWNLLSLLTRGVVSVPSFLAGMLSAPTFGQSSTVLELGGLTATLSGGLLIALAGTLLGGLYLLLIVRELRKARPDMVSENRSNRPGQGLMGEMGRTWLRLVILAVALLVALLVVLVPLSLIAVLLGMVSQGLALGAMSLLSVAMFTVFMWAGFILTFVAEAIVLEGASVRQAIWRSANIVWRNLWPTLGLVLLSYVIGAGFTFIWDRFAASTWGVALGILGTAFIGAGLSAAALTFYADRRRRLLETPRPRVV